MKRNRNKQIKKKEGYKFVVDNRRCNQGSATIEMTGILSVVLVVFYLYITLFLFYIHCAKDLSTMVESLYQHTEQQRNNDEEEFLIHTMGDKIIIYSRVTMQTLSKELELHRYNDSPVDNIRRWQLATDTVLQRGTS